MNPASKPVFPFPHGQMQFVGISVRDLARIAALHGLLVGGTDLDPQEAADYALKAADALFPQPQAQEPAVNLTALMGAAALAEAVKAGPGKKSWRLW